MHKFTEFRVGNGNNKEDCLNIQFLIFTQNSKFKILFYSYLKASIGDIWDALRAGYNPKIIPIKAETPKATNTE